MSLSFDPELKTQWLTALRSGEYQQGTGFLHLGGKYCCLGVLLRVAGYSVAELGEHVTVSGVDVGLANRLERGEGDRTFQVKLEKRNDGINILKHSFAEIADFIEANL